MNATTQTLGRFDHHPDPALDFCVEVEALEGLKADMAAGVATAEEADEFRPRIKQAMFFRVGGDPIAIRAKAMLRDLAGIPQPPFPG